MGDLTHVQKAQIQRLQDNLSALRRIAGWTMEELGNRIGVTKQTISNLESHSKKAHMSLTQYLAIRSVLDYEAATRLKEDRNNTLLALAIKKVLDDDLGEDEAKLAESDVALIAAAVAGKASSETVAKLANEKIGVDLLAKTLSVVSSTSVGLNAHLGLPISPLLLGLGIFGWMEKLRSAEHKKETQPATHHEQSSGKIEN
ncbi:MAG: helix-turn-helix transcriptional regulator [Oscillospiraceae bacterium]|nr:helix-turn-helix transcriptional regulator [Oscillospiraceae bacterium]